MTLVVETGAGISNAEAYVAVSDVDTYASNRNLTSWASLSTAVKEAAIREATIYVDAKFTFSGTKKLSTQALQWPRTEAYDAKSGLDVASDIVPEPVKQAVKDLAIKAASSSILEDLARGGAVKQESVGPLSVTYTDNAPAGTVYFIEGLLKGLTIEGSGRGPVFEGPVYASDQFFSSGQFDNEA